jgi:hypothetical protein
MRFKQVRILLPALFGVAVAMAVYAQTPTRLVGSVAAISGHSITIQPDKGAPSTLTVSDTARILRTQPGMKTLAGATAIPLTDLAVGDRVLAIVNGGTATTVIAMKQADIAKEQSAAAADWQRRGAGGVVKAVDTSAGTVTIAAGARTFTIRTTPKTIVRRYSPDSAQFADSKPSTLQEIHAGDQLRVLGDRSADGAEITAEEIVAGTFRNIAGIVLSTNPAGNSMTVRDLATKKPVVLHITAESQLHKLPPATAQAIALRLKKPSGAGGGEQHGQPPGQPANGQIGKGGGPSNGDLSQIIGRAPAVTLSDLHKGDAVMIVATQGTPDSATAVTLVSGVEPILRSPSGSQNMFSASWNLSGGGGGASAGGGEGTPQ